MLKPPILLSIMTHIEYCDTIVLYLYNVLKGDNMNKVNHDPDKSQSELIAQIRNYCKNPSITNRITKTMLNKSIIDTRKPFVKFLKENHLINYPTIIQNDIHLYIPVKILNSNGITHKEASFYSAATRRDKRFSITTMQNDFNANDLIYITFIDNHLIIITLDNHSRFIDNLENLFKIS